LDLIQYENNTDELKIGALTTLRSIIDSQLIKKLQPSIVASAKTVAAPPIRNKATIGGNICLDTRCLYYNQSAMWRKSRELCFKAGGKVCNAVKGAKRCFAVFSADLPPLLIALDAEVEVFSSDNIKIIKLKDFYTGKGKKPNILEPNEIVTKVIIRDFSKKKGFYEKFRIRNAIDYPLAGVAVGFYKDNPNKINIVLNAVESKPVLMENIDLQKQNIEEIKEMIIKKAKPVANMTSTPEYRKEVCARLFEKIIDSLDLGFRD
jgi:4-hydroxybenzoyl-CoA reductase subunit beta